MVMSGRLWMTDQMSTGVREGRRVVRARRRRCGRKEVKWEWVRRREWRASVGRWSLMERRSSVGRWRRRDLDLRRGVEGGVGCEELGVVRGRRVTGIVDVWGGWVGGDWSSGGGRRELIIL